MGNTPSQEHSLTDRLEELRKRFRPLTSADLDNVHVIAGFQRDLARISGDLEAAIRDGKIKVGSVGATTLRESVKVLAQNFDWLASEAAKKLDDGQKLLTAQELAKKKQRQREIDEEIKYEGAVKDLTLKCERLEGVIKWTGLDHARASENDKPRLAAEIEKAEKELKEVTEQLRLLRSDTGMEAWVAEYRIRAEAADKERERLADEKRKKAPAHPVEKLDFGIKDYLGQLEHTTTELLEAGNDAGGYQAPDPDESAMREAIARASGAVETLLDNAELNQAGHTSAIYGSIDQVVTAAYLAGYRLDNEQVLEALKDLVIAYASASNTSASGERDQDATLLRGLYADLSKVKIIK
jgi:hypothetical protein